jgi:HEAT repeat protein
MISRAGAYAVAGLVIAGGVSGAAPRICLSPLLCAALPDFTRASAPAVEQASAPSIPGKTARVTAAPVTLPELHAAIDHLGAFEYADRSKAAQTVRRAVGTMAVPALLQAASEHTDGYVRYRALVLLSGYTDPRVRDQMEQALADPNDRLRAVGYEYFERHPEPRLIPTMLAALDKEVAEFVRPSLVRALAANTTDSRVREPLVRDVTHGQDFFRSTVIEALGDYKATYALPAITAVARLEGPLQDDATLALGKIGDKRSMTTLVELQRTAPREIQPIVAASICLLGTNCDSHRGYLVKTLTFADKTIGYQTLLRSAATGLGAMAASGDTVSLDALFDTGIPAQDPARAPIALALAGVAVKNPPLLLERLQKRQDRPAALALLRDGFDMLEEEFAEENFYVTVRHAYWAATAGSAAKAAAQSLIQTLEF